MRSVMEDVTDAFAFRFCIAWENRRTTVRAVMEVLGKNGHMAPSYRAWRYQNKPMKGLMEWMRP